MEWLLLAPLGGTERAALLAATRRRSYARGEVLFHDGDPADCLHLVESGHLAVQVTTPHGDRATINVLRSGDTVGELALVERTVPGHRSATVVALDPTCTRVLTATAFRTLRHRYPGVEDVLVSVLADRVRELSDRLLEAMYVGLDRRVYRRLLELCRVYDEAGVPPVVIPLTQDQLADLVGGTRPTVNQVLQRLQACGVIGIARGRVLIHDPSALSRKSGV
jgi:CRP-like cAMP-binding protein